MSAYDSIRAAMDAAALEAQLSSDLEDFRHNVALGRVEADTAWEAELADARQALSDARQASVWAALFSGENAGHVARHQLLAGGLRRPLEQLGVTREIPADRIYDVLRADADWLREAASPEQRAALQGGDPRTATAATWDDSDDGRKVQRSEKQAEREAYKRLWGREPGEWDFIA